jgi:sortase (surface protein transpeptidase)
VRQLPRSVPVAIRIPAIGVNAPVMELGLNSDRTIQVPPLSNLNLAGWYKYGAAPGQQGAAVIVGHIDSTAGAAVFFRLRYLTRGELVYVALADGKTAVFTVDGLQQVPKTAFPTMRVYGPVPYAGLRLVTCGGVFDPATGHYLSDVIVFAHLA